MTRLEGIAHDLAHYLDNQFWFGYYRDLNKVDTNILEQKTQFDKSCLSFFKERLPKTFDFDRFKRIRVKATRVKGKLTISVNVNLDDKEVKYSSSSTMSFT